MYDYMDRSAIKALRKIGKTYSEIGEEMNCDRRTVKRILEEPLEKIYKKGNLEPSQVDIYKEDIFKWLDQVLFVNYFCPLFQTKNCPV
jgi:transposase